ncbi:transcriptional antiterminator, BglG family [Streptococcus henryi]|jgi:transcriptional antiterminator|uniref:Transcriptional antiterminator, BglG family n=1 Tax=Streptococcus henryi TaxID=439219 RepID=A0A1G6B0A6_9STRE|nr:PRD domain-containing protein [Streptococcus henryi]SDB14101.1 transcriptional antiterminator, BglG family [Streptococcus henryi]
MFRIIQALNNNVALVKNEQGEQAVVMGLGIVFRKKKGDLIRPEQVEKIFSLKTEESKENFLMLLKNIPLDILTVTYNMIDKLVQNHQFPVQEYLYVTLTDHVYSVYQKLLKGTYQESRLPDISKEYVTEFSMAREAVEILSNKLSVNFPDDEIGRMALHFINAKGDYEISSNQEESARKRVLELVEEELSRNGIRRNAENSNLYDRLMIHLTYLINRLQTSQQDETSLVNMEDFVKSDYPKAFRIGQAIHRILEQEFKLDLSRSERVYLVLHIQRLLN